MSGSSFFRTVALVVLLVLLAAVGVSLYNAGVSAGLSQQLQQVVQDGQTVTVAPYPYGPYWHGGGFGFFSVLFWIIGILLVIGLIRAVFGWGRGGRGGPGHWGGHWYGRGGYRSDRVADWHRELHRREEVGHADSDENSQLPRSDRTAPRAFVPNTMQ